MLTGIVYEKACYVQKLTNTKSKMSRAVLHREHQLKWNQEFIHLSCLKRGHARCVFWGHNRPLCLSAVKFFCQLPYL